MGYGDPYILSGPRVYVRCRDIEHGPCTAGREIPGNDFCGTMEECAACACHPKRATYEKTKRFDYAWEHPMVVVEQAGTKTPAETDERILEALKEIQAVLDRSRRAAERIDGGVQTAIRQGAAVKAEISSAADSVGLKLDSIYGENGEIGARTIRLLEQILQKGAGGGLDIDVEKVKALSNFDIPKIKDHTAVGSSFGELVKLLLLALTNNI